jgi:hypothetical protein
MTRREKRALFFVDAERRAAPPNVDAVAARAAPPLPATR